MTAHNAPKTVCRYLTLRSLQTKKNIDSRWDQNSASPNSRTRDAPRS
jgi:hypothetical protein